MSSSPAMHNLLVRSLSSSNADNRQRVEVEDRLAELADRAATDHLTEDGNMERMDLESELERLIQEAEDLRARGRARANPKAAGDRLSQSHHDPRYRQARAKGVAHSAAWKPRRQD